MVNGDQCLRVHTCFYPQLISGSNEYLRQRFWKNLIRATRQQDLQGSTYANGDGHSRVHVPLSWIPIPFEQLWRGPTPVAQENILLVCDMPRRVGASQ